MHMEGISFPYGNRIRTPHSAPTTPLPGAFVSDCPPESSPSAPDTNDNGRDAAPVAEE